MRHLLLALCLLLPAAPSQAQISIGIGVELPGISIGINLPAYPAMVRVPGYPVYYAPRLSLNFFFYDGLYWVYSDDRWYASDWYNGPWQEVEPEYMPLFVLRVPIRYYRRPPMYFRYWRPDRAPRWDEHWGHDWSRRHRDWDRWDPREAPAPAPLPHYQRRYSEKDYPRSSEQQREISSRNYRYQPREAITQQHFQQRGQEAPPRREPQYQRPDRRQPSNRPDDEQWRGAPERRQPMPQPEPDKWSAPGRQRQDAPEPRRNEAPQRRDMPPQTDNPYRSHAGQEPRDKGRQSAPQHPRNMPDQDELLLQQQRGRDRNN